MCCLSSIIHWMVRLLATWLQIYAVCLICRPDDVWNRHSLTSSMSASRSIQLLETELSLWLALDYGTVCRLILLRATHCHGSVVNSKHLYLDSHIVLFCFSFLCGPFGFYRAMHFSAKRGIAIACRLSVRLSPSVCLSVRNVEVLWLHRLEIFKNNFMVS